MPHIHRLQYHTEHCVYSEILHLTPCCLYIHSIQYHIAYCVYSKTLHTLCRCSTILNGALFNTTLYIQHRTALCVYNSILLQSQLLFTVLLLLQFMNFIILIIARAGFKGDPVAPFHIDGAIISILVSYGLFLVVLIQLIAILLGDKTPISVRFYVILL